MTDEKINLVIDQITRLTIENKLKWDLAQASSSSFTTKADPYDIYINYTGLSFSFIVLDKAGRQIGSKTENTFITIQGEKLNVQNLYEIVKNKTIGNNLDDLLNKLKNI